GLAAEQMTIDPEVTGLLLRQRIEHVARPERAQKSGRIGAAGMIALASASIERDRLAAMAFNQVAQARGDFADRGVPVDLVKAAVGPAAERRGQPVAVMRIEGNPRGLVAEIAFRFRMVAVAPHLGDPAVIDEDLDPAIDIADVARGLLPSCLRHRASLRNRSPESIT